MKRKLPLSSLALFFVLLMASGAKAQSKLIHYWHFNNTQPTTGAGGTHLGTSPIYADYTRYNSSAYIRYTKVPQCIKDTGYIDNNVGDSTNQRPGYGACCPVFGATTNNSSVRTRNPSDSMVFLWYIPTKNFKNIVIKYASEASSTTSGPHRQNYDYSLDSGLTYINTGLPRLFDSAGTGWGKVTLNLSSINTINNTSKLIFRIKTSAPNTGSSGNIRYDNITVEGDSITSTATGIHEATQNAAGYGVYPNPANEQLFIKTPGNKTSHVVITDIAGQVIYQSEIDGKDPIDISRFKRGIYFVRLNAADEENNNVIKFVKE